VFGSEIGREEFQSLPPQKLPGDAFAQLAPPQMLRLCITSKPRFDFFE
jgi:hypothetical protein